MDKFKIEFCGGSQRFFPPIPLIGDFIIPVPQYTYSSLSPLLNYLGDLYLFPLISELCVYTESVWKSVCFWLPEHQPFLRGLIPRRGRETHVEFKA